MSNLYIRELSIDASYQVSVHLSKPFQRRRFFRNQPNRNKNCLCWPCLLMDRNEMNISNRGEESKKSAYQKQELPVAVIFANDWDGMSNLYRGASIDASNQVSDYLAKRFQRRRFLEITQSETRIAVATMFVNGSGRNEQPLERCAHRCFQPSFGLFGKAVSENIF
jgi:hypothetical protein